MLRRRVGFGRAVEVDTALAAVIGACDGELPLGVLIGAVAVLLEVEQDAWILEDGAYWASDGGVELGLHREGMITSVLGR